MSIDREKLLHRIKDSLQHALLPDATPEHPGSFQSYTYQANAPVIKLIEDFSRELEALSGHVYVPANSAEAIPIILEILRKQEAQRIIAWDEAQLGLSGLGPALARAGIVIEDSHLPTDGTARQARLAQLNDVLVGLSGAHGGLADTGALALINGPGRGRLASLLPPVHIALLPAQKLYPSLPAFLAANPTATTESSNLVFITGPSRTADIEMTLSIGVHGPKEVYVIILP